MEPYDSDGKLNAGWQVRDGMAPLFPDGQERRTEVLFGSRCRGEVRLLELVSVQQRQSDARERGYYESILDHPIEVFALAWKFAGFGCRASAAQARGALDIRWRRMSTMFRRLHIGKRL